MPCLAWEWLRLPDGTVILAAPMQQWVVPSVRAGAWAKPMHGPGSVPTTRSLLDGAVMAGWSAGCRRAGLPSSDATDASSGSATALLGPESWAFRLVCLYHTTHATPALMAEASTRFARAGRSALAQWAATKAREEQGHDVLALRDLAELGYDAPALVRALVPAGPAALVRYFECAVRQDDPLGCVGYCYALERLALESDAAFIAQVEASLPAGCRATRCLRVHSACGSDRDHVEETVTMVASLSASERTRVALASYETATLCARARRDERLDASDLQIHRTPPRADPPTTRP